MGTGFQDEKGEVINMQCFHCQGELRRGKSTYTVNRDGYHLIIENMPAWVCQQCGEALFEEEQVDAIQRLIRETDANVELLLQVAAA
ncbi:MAG: type II toxin-antitoxin system MqsA family antitoxin [Anaerolineae bacterium]